MDRARGAVTHVDEPEAGRTGAGGASIEAGDRQQNRPDLLATEETEIAIIEKYLPQQLLEDELKEKLQAIMTRIGASAPSDMGKVMGVATKELAGQADGKAISAMVKQLLQ